MNGETIVFLAWPIYVSKSLFSSTVILTSFPLTFIFLSSTGGKNSFLPVLLCSLYKIAPNLSAEPFSKPSIDPNTPLTVLSCDIGSPQIDTLEGGYPLAHVTNTFLCFWLLAIWSKTLSAAKSAFSGAKALFIAGIVAPKTTFPNALALLTATWFNPPLHPFLIASTSLAPWSNIKLFNVDETE